MFHFLLIHIKTFFFKCYHRLKIINIILINNVNLQFSKNSNICLIYILIYLKIQFLWSIWWSNFLLRCWDRLCISPLCLPKISKFRANINKRGKIIISTLLQLLIYYLFLLWIFFFCQTIYFDWKWKLKLIRLLLVCNVPEAVNLWFFSDKQTMTCM